MAKQSRSLETQEKLLQAAADFLRTNDEALLRITDLSQITETNISTLYYQFGSREELIEEAYIKLYRDYLEPEIMGLKLLGESTLDGSRIKEAIVASIIENSNAKERLIRRTLQLRIFAAASLRPSLQEKLGKVQTEYSDALEAFFKSLQVRKIVRSDISPRMMELMFFRIYASRSFHDFSSIEVTDDEWSKLVAFFLDLFLI